MRPVTSARLLVDTTAWDTARGERVFRQEIFDEMLRMVDEASVFLCLDFFLWNDWQGVPPETARRMSGALAEALIRKKKSRPDVDILVLTDPINLVYGDRAGAPFDALAEAGIFVAFTDLFRLPESNPVHAAYVGAFGPLLRALGGRLWDRPVLANPLQAQGEKISLRQASRLFYFKANHRKVLLADGPGGARRLLVTSLNPADGSSAHGNLALVVEGEAARDALASELACMEWSADGPYGLAGGVDRRAWREAIRRVRGAWPVEPAVAAEATAGPRAQWLTEGAIQDRLLALLDDARAGDEIRVALFYLSRRPVVEALADAAARGAIVRLILDPNRDAFGRVKNGIPNRPVAAELMARAQRGGWDLVVRWADTHGEQFHPKAICLTRPGGDKAQLLAGSANWTRRNLANLNMEANLCLEDVPALAAEYVAWFDRLWSNRDGLVHTTDYAAYEESAWTRWWKSRLYRFQEATGLSTF